MYAPFFKVQRPLKIPTQIPADEPFTNYLLNSFYEPQITLHWLGHLDLVLCDLYLRVIPPINLWNTCIYLRLLSKYLVGLFLRPLRSKEVGGWILRLLPQNILASSESSAANLKKVKQTSVWQTVPKFLFFCLFLLFLKDLLM